MSNSDRQKLGIVAEEMATYMTSVPGYSPYPSMRGIPLSGFFFGQDAYCGYDSNGDSDLAFYVY